MRSTEAKLLPIPFASGMDESAGTRSAATPRLYSVVNMRSRSAGTLEKRNGTRALPGTTSVPSGTEYCLVNGGGVARPTEHGALVAKVGEQLIAGTTGGYAFSWSDDANGWKFRGAFSTCEPLSEQAVISSSKYATETSSLGRFSAAAMNADGYVCFVNRTQTGGGSFLAAVFTVVSPNGVEIYAATIGTVTSAKVVNTGVTSGGNVTDGFVVVYGTGNVNAITVAIVNGAAVVSSPVVIVATSGAGWDVSGYDQSQWLLAHNANATDIEVYKVSETTPTLVATQAESATSITIYGDTLNAGFWVGYLNNGGVDVKFFAGKLDGTSLVATTLLKASAVLPSPPVFGPMNSAVTPTSVIWAYSEKVANTTPTVSTVYVRTTTYGSCTTGGSTVTLGRMGNVIPVSKPDSKQRIWVSTSVEQADDYDNFTPFRSMLVRLEGLSDTTVVEQATELFPNIGTYSPGTSPTGFTPVAVATDGNGEYGFPLSVPVTTETVGSAQTPLFHSRLYRYRDITQRGHVNVGTALVLTGQPASGTTLKFAGTSSTSAGLTEVGFPFSPSIIYTEQSTGASGLDIGTYAYVVLLEWADENGNRVLSAPSVPRIVEITANSSRVFMLIAAPYGIGEKTNNISTSVGKPIAKIYRTTAGGTNYQRVGGGAGTESPGMLSFTDTVSDADLSDEEFVYTDGGVLPNQLAPSCRFLASAEDRLWCGGLWDPTLLEASKVRVPGEPINFTGDASHQVVLPAPCTGLAYMDGQVVAFAASAIFLVGGDGPNDQGAGSFLPPRMLSRSIGCVEPRSIVETEIGIFFQSEVGFYLLPRGFGAPVLVSENFHESLDSFPDIIAACATSTKDFRVVRFLAAASGEASATHCYTFDMDSKQWFLDSFSAANGTYDGFSALGPWDDGCALLRYDLTSAVSPLWAEDADYYGDEGAAELSGGSTFIDGQIQTTWIYPFGFGGWGKVNKAMVSLDHVYGSTVSTTQTELALDLELDDLASPISDAWDVPTGSVSASYRGMDVTRPRMTAVRATVTIGEASQAATGTASARGPKVLGITFEIGPDGGDNGIRPTIAGTERT